MINLKYKMQAALTHVIADLFGEVKSETCELLVDEIKKAGYGQIHHKLRQTAMEWARASNNWVDKHVIAVELEKDTEARVRGVVLTYTACGWDKDEREKANYLEATAGGYIVPHSIAANSIIANGVMDAMTSAKDANAPVRGDY